MKFIDKIDRINFSESIRLPITIACIFWLIEIMEYLGEVNIHNLGIYPRELKGLPGIVFSPFLHGDFKHLLNNTPSFVVLSTAIIAFYPKNAIRIMTFIYLFTGVGVWLFARPAYHIGASGLVYGFASFLFFHGLFRRDVRSLGISLAVAFLFNGMLYGIFPVETGVSWESHVIGAICGVAVAFAYRDLAFKPDEKTWQKEGAEHVIEGYQNIEAPAFKYTFVATKNDELENSWYIFHQMIYFFEC